MIEPTESESKEECDYFIEAMKSVAEEAEKNPEVVKTAPHTTRIRRLDEVGAARKPILRWKKGLKVEEKPHKVMTGPVVPTC
jgi:glycine dehydrogenase subunit 2